VVRTALNANISLWRRRQREISLPDLGMVADGFVAHHPADTALDSGVLAVLLRLPTRQRQVIALRLLLDLDTTRTAELLGIEAADFRMTTPEDQIIGRGRATRARRQVRRFAAGALATGALATAAVVAAATAPHSAGQSDVTLAAWTVKSEGNGTIKVTIRELRDRAGLQRKLRAEGVPINLRYFGEPNPPCRVYLIRFRVPGHPGKTYAGGGVDPGARIIQYGNSGPKSPVVFIIRPSAIPAHAGIAVWVASPALYARYSDWAIATALVHASPRCTGT
jgi:hypothetical protein